MGVRRGIRVAVVVGAVALGATGCAGVRPTLGEPVSAPSAGAAPYGARVAMVGDSLTSGEFATLPLAAEARGLRLDISAEPGRRVAGGSDELHRLAAGHDLLVVALGTNDAEPGLTTQQAGALIDAAFGAAASSAPVLWLTVHRPAGTASGEAATAFNAALADARGRHPMLVVVDWAAVVAARPDLLGADGTHLTADGYAVRTAWLVDRIVEHLTPAPG